jgi:hypothetical protein
LHSRKNVPGALNRKHQLYNKDNSPAKVLVVFVGEEGKPTTMATKLRQQGICRTMSRAG